MDPLPSMGHMTIIMWGWVILSPIGKCTITCYQGELLFSGRIQQSEPCRQPLYFHLPTFRFAFYRWIWMMTKIVSNIIVGSRLPICVFALSIFKGVWMREEERMKLDKLAETCIWMLSKWEKTIYSTSMLILPPFFFIQGNSAGLRLGPAHACGANRRDLDTFSG